MSRKCFIEAYETRHGWKCKVYDQGCVTMCEYDREKKDWIDCIFNTRKEAEDAGRQYDELWKEA